MLNASIFLPKGEVVVSTELAHPGPRRLQDRRRQPAAAADRRPDRPQHGLGGGDPHRGARRRRRGRGRRHPLLRQGRLPAGDRPLQRRRAEADGRRVLHPERRQPRRQGDPPRRLRRATCPATKPRRGAANAPSRVLAGSEQGDWRRAHGTARVARGATPEPSRRTRARRSRRCCARSSVGAASAPRSRPRRGGRRGRAERAAAAPRPDRAADLHRRPGDRARLRRRGLGAARGRRRSGSGSTSPTSPPTCGPGSPLDREARRRANSTYAPGTVEPMLPHALSEDACSLAPGVERLAVTAEIELGPRGASRGGAASTAAAIRSDARLDYDQLDVIFAGRAARRRRSPSRWRLARDGGRGSGRAARRDQPRRRVLRARVPLRRRRQRGRRPRRSPQTESHRLIERLMILANEQVAAAAGAQAGAGDLPRPRPARPGPGRAADRAAARRSGSRRRRCAGTLAPRAGRRARGRGEPAGAPGRPRGAATAARRIHRSCSDRSSRPTTASATAATPGSAAPPTAISPRRSGATRTWSSTGPCWRRSGRARRRRAPPRRARRPRTAASASASRCGSSARPTTSAPPSCSSASCASAGRDASFEGEVSGVIRGRRLRRASAASWATSTRASCRRARPGGAERFELNETETALVGAGVGPRAAPRRPDIRPGHAASKRPAAGSTWSRRRLARWRKKAKKQRSPASGDVATNRRARHKFELVERSRRGSCCAARR